MQVLIMVALFNSACKYLMFYLNIRLANLNVKIQATNYCLKLLGNDLNILEGT